MNGSPTKNKAPNFYTVSGQYEWYDLGDFSVLWRISKKDKEGNSLVSLDEGKWIGIDTFDSMIVSEGKRIVATVGLSDIVVVATDNAVLVIPKALAQKVKKIVEKLKEEGKKEFL